MGTVTGSLTGRRIVVTGASKGIGRGTATVLAGLGAHLALIARDASALDELVGQLPGGPHEAIAFDVADEQAWQRARPRIAPTGRLDGIVAAAALIGPIGPVGTWLVDDFRRTIDVNLTGTLLAVTTCLDCLRPGGSVVTFSGGGATAPFPRFDGYAASKAAVVRLTENLAVELASDDIRVNAVAPGFIVTPMHDDILAAGVEAVGTQFFERTRNAHERGAGDSPAAVHELVAFLLSDDSAGITGRVISAQWDPWPEESFRRRLRADPDLATLRRVDGQFFAAVPKERT
jgi:3-oxoacyl-[acyl-carrier protein] reductase